jgi:hypothetical protein
VGYTVELIEQRAERRPVGGHHSPADEDEDAPVPEHDEVDVPEGEDGFDEE